MRYRAAERVTAGQVFEGIQGWGKNSRSACRNRNVCLVRSQINVLCARANRDRLGQVAVTGDHPQLVPVGAHHSENVRIAAVALGPQRRCAAAGTGQPA